MEAGRNDSGVVMDKARKNESGQDKPPLSARIIALAMNKVGSGITAEDVAKSRAYQVAQKAAVAVKVAAKAAPSAIAAAHTGVPVDFVSAGMKAARAGLSHHQGVQALVQKVAEVAGRTAIERAVTRAEMRQEAKQQRGAAASRRSEPQSNRGFGMVPAYDVI